MWNADDLLKNVHPELDNYAFNKDVQHTEDFIFCMSVVRT